MNAVEKLEGQFAAHERRVRRLEELLASRMALKPDEREACEVAKELGLPEQTLFLGGAARSGVSNTEARARAANQRKLARELRAREWSVTRIARVFYCGDKTARRWLAR